MTALAMALLWAAVLLTAMTAAELKPIRKLIPTDEPTSIPFELTLSIITITTLIALSILLGPIIGPAQPFTPSTAAPAVPIA